MSTRQTVSGNVVGFSGSGIIGGADLSSANTIAQNETGVSGFTGTVAYDVFIANVTGVSQTRGSISDNRFQGNAVGIAATDRQVIFDNEMIFDTNAAILLSGVGNVRIAGNLIRATGDAIRLQDGATNADIVSNVLWSDAGYAVNVANDSQAGFWSDYNTLYAGPKGKLVYWTRDFTDILDWQDDVARFDLHSIGRTVVDPERAIPHLLEGATGLFSVMPLEAGQRSTDFTAGTGDPAGSFIGHSGVANLLTDGDFETADEAGFQAGHDGWTVTAGGYTTTTGPVAYTGSAVFQSGPAGTAVAQQRLDLVAAGYTVGNLDSGSLQVAFGGRVLLPSSAVSATILLTFLDADGNPTGQTTTLAAGSTTGRYQRLFDTVRVPTGARSVEYTFSVSNGGTSQGGTLDDAFLGVVGRGVDVDQGTGPAAAAPAQPTVPASGGRLALTSPDLYTDWDADTARLITWNSFGAAVGAPVRLELWQDTPNGPTFRAVIAASAADTGAFKWTPSDSGVADGTHGLRIRIASVSDPAVFDVSAETFTTPEAGTAYYVNDSSSVGDVPLNGSAIGLGSNRNDGKTPDAPKPNPVNLFRTYDIGPGSTVYIETGDYPLIDTLRLSGSVDRGFGFDSGFTIQGPSSGAALLHPAIPTSQPAALIDLLDADYVTLNNLSFGGGVTAVLVHGGSDNFSASYLTADGQSGNAFDITTNSPGSTLDHLTATHAGGDGLSFSGAIAGITNFVASGDQEGISAPNGATIGRISGSTITGSRDWGIDIGLLDGANIFGNTVTGNREGIHVTGAGYFGGSGMTTLGDADLTKGDGNVVTGNRDAGILAYGPVDVVGNVENGAANGTGLYITAGAKAENNIVSGNATGIDREYNSTAALSGNRVFGNSGTGIIAGSGGLVIDNVVYGNTTGIYVGGSVTLTNNLVYDDSAIGLLVSGNATIINNTIYEPVAGTGTGAPYTPVGQAAVVIYGAYQVTFTNNIVVALAGIGLAVSDSAQTGLTSNYNLFSTGAGGRVGNWLGVDRASLSAWRTASGKDKNSLSADPDFVDVDGADGILGTPDDDFHVQTPNGVYAGGSLAVVLANGRLTFPAGTLTTTSTQTSPAIDAGDPATPVGAERSPNGNVVEVGAYGGTAQASLSPQAFLHITFPNGGETLFQGSTVAVTWTTFNVAGTVDLAITDGKTRTVIATGIADTGSFSWSVDPSLAGTTFRIQIQSDGDPAIADTSDGTFSISPPVHDYYVNANGDGGGSFTTAGGSDQASGLDVADPMQSLGALLAKYKLGAGDTVHVDDGTYKLTQNIVFDATQGGTADNPVRIIGDGDKTVFDRGSNSDRFYDFEFTGADNIAVSNLRLTGAQWQAYLDYDAGSTGIAFSNVTVDTPTSGNSGIYVGEGNNGFTVTGSRFNGPGYDGIQLDNPNNATIIGSSFTGWGTGVSIGGTTGTTLRNDTFVDNNAATSTGFSQNLTFDHLTVSGGYYGISTYRSGGIVENSTVHDTGAFGLDVDNAYGWAFTAVNNTVYNVGGGNAYANAFSVSGSSTASGNTVYDSYNGMVVSGTAVVTGTVLYGNTNDALTLDGGTVTGSYIHDNVVGAYISYTSATFANNLLVDNATGILLYGGSPRIVNNTIVQASGDAVTVQNAVYNLANWDFRDNILSIGSGATGLDIPSYAQQGVTADYNLFDVAAGGTAIKWSGLSYDFAGWQLQLGFDPHGLLLLPGQPLFKDAPHGDYTLAVGSPAIDRGDPTLSFTSEPAPNGGRIDIGAYGNTAEAGPSPAQEVEITSPAGPARYAIGDQLTINFSSSGIVSKTDLASSPTSFELANSPAPILLINAGGNVLTGPAGTYLADADRLNGQTEPVTASPSYSGAPFRSLMIDADQPPAALFQTIAYSNTGVGQKLSYSLPVGDVGDSDTYAVTLYFAEFSATGPGQHLFDILINGQSPTSALLDDQTSISPSMIDPYVIGGGQNGAFSITVLAKAVNGTIALDLYDESNTRSAYVNGIAVAPLPVGTSGATATISASFDGGAYVTIAQNVPVNFAGQGSYTWTVDRTGTAKFKVDVNGVDSTPVQDGNVTLVPAGHTYYVNPNTAAGGDLTTAAGNDAHSGKSAADPLASLQALLHAYQLKPGDTVVLDAGTYDLASNLTFTAATSGAVGAPIKITGDGIKTILNRGGTANSTIGLDFEGAHDIEIDNLAVRNATDAIILRGSTNITFNGIDVSQFSSYNNTGIYAASGTTNLTVINSAFHDQAASAYGIYLDGVTGATISNDTFTNVSTGVNTNFGSNVTVSGSTFSKIGSRAINVFATTTVSISNNTVSGAGDIGIYAYAGYQAPTTISGNTVSGAANVGVQVDSGAVAKNNETFGNGTGIVVKSGSIATGNLIHDNIYGVIDGNGSTTISGNTIYDNQYGTDFQNYANFSNNLLYGNTVAGIYSDAGGANPTITNNTIVQTSGTAVDLTYSYLGNGGSSWRFQNNIIDASGAGTQAWVVALASEINFASDWNDIHLSGGATFGSWGGNALATFNDWRFQTAFDQDSTDLDPGFVDRSSNNYHLAAGSAAIDRGNPTSAYGLEPGNNGGRINLGSDGDTAQATPDSSAQTVQVLSPNGLDKLEIGTPTTISFRTAGFVDPTTYELANTVPVLLSNENGAAVTSAAGTFVSTDYATHRDGRGTDGSGTPFESLIPDPDQPPQALFNSYDWSNSGTGDNVTYAVPVADGTYALTLYFADPGSSPGQHNFDILVNGQSPGTALLNDKTVISAAGIEPEALAGGRDNTAISVTGLATAMSGWPWRV